MKNKAAARALRFPEQFRITTLVTGIDPTGFIQHFVHAVSFYSFFIAATAEQQRRSNYILLDSMISRGKSFSGHPDPQVRQINENFLAQINQLIQQEALTEPEKLERSTVIMCRWKAALYGHFSFPEVILLENGKEITLSFDFNLIAALTGRTAGQAISHFMRGTAIAVWQAKQPSQLPDQFRLFFNASAGLKMETGPHVLPLNRKYHEKYKVLRKQLQTEKRYRYRLSAWKNFYREWYQELLAASASPAMTGKSSAIV